MTNRIKKRQHAQVDLEHYFKQLSSLFKYEKEQEAVLYQSEIDEFHRIIVDLGEFIQRIQRGTNRLLAEQEIAQIGG